MRPEILSGLVSIVFPLVEMASSGEPSDGRKMIVATVDPPAERGAIPAWAEAKPG